MLGESFFVAEEAIPKDVTLPDGTVHTLHFRQLPAAEFRKLYTGKEDMQSALIAASLCTPDGKPALTLQQAMKLKAPAEKVLIAAVKEINGVTEEQKNG